jgi:hypothetical protein
MVKLCNPRLWKKAFHIPEFKLTYVIIFFSVPEKNSWPNSISSSLCTQESFPVCIWPSVLWFVGHWEKGKCMMAGWRDQGLSQNMWECPM